jgi:hypothetical protein
VHGSAHYPRSPHFKVLSGGSSSLLSDHPDVFVSLCTNANDLMNTINFVQNNQQNKENRLFIIFQKSQQKFNRNHIVNMISKHKRFHKKAPVIASLSKQYSVITYMYEVLE